MKRPPESFISDYAVFRERVDWAERADLDEDLVQTQLFYANMREFLDRWQGNIGVTELEAGLAKVRPIVDKIGQLIDQKYLEALRDLLERRHTVLIHPQIYEIGLAYLEIMKLTPEKLRPELKSIFRESIGYDFDAERFYREIEGDFEKYGTEYNQALAIMEVTWPDHFTAETRARLAREPIEKINDWKAKVSAQLNETN
ncbi:MAG TPA: hypothetical protein VLH83_12550 [Chthoniobacterales bacterium]|nr:hypothetical protein [Chthoniobacterales bacterium]